MVENLKDDSEKFRDYDYECYLRFLKIIPSKQKKSDFKELFLDVNSKINKKIWIIMMVYKRFCYHISQNNQKFFFIFIKYLLFAKELVKITLA